MIHIPFTRQGGIDLRYVQSLFAGFHEEYDIVLLVMTLGFDYIWKRIVRQYIPGSSRRILDLGAGTGVLSFMFDDDREIVGMDISGEMLRVAARKKSRANGSKEFVQACAEYLPFRHATFDAVVSCYVMKYCYRKLMLDEVFRVSADGCIVAVYDFSMPKAFSPTWFFVFKFMPQLAAVMRRVWRGFATVLSDLPAIIGKVRWESDLATQLAHRRVLFPGLIRMTNQVVTLIVWKVSKNQAPRESSLPASAMSRQTR